MIRHFLILGLGFLVSVVNGTDRAFANLSPACERKASALLGEQIAKKESRLIEIYNSLFAELTDAERSNLARLRIAANLAMGKREESKAELDRFDAAHKLNLTSVESAERRAIVERFVLNEKETYVSSKLLYETTGGLLLGKYSVATKVIRRQALTQGYECLVGSSGEFICEYQLTGDDINKLYQFRITTFHATGKIWGAMALTRDAAKLDRPYMGDLLYYSMFVNECSNENAVQITKSSTPAELIDYAISTFVK